MVLRLFGSEAGDRREDTESIAAEHDDVGWLAVGDARDLSVGNELDRVGAACILGDGNIIVIRVSVGRVVYDIFEDGAEPDCSKDLGFLRDQHRSRWLCSPSRLTD